MSDENDTPVEKPMSKWEQREQILTQAHLEELADVKRHRLAIELSNALGQEQHRTLMERWIGVAERETSALEQIATALGKPITFQDGFKEG
jgi:hypothetical protein